MGTPGNKIYDDAAGTILSAAGGYIKTNQSTSYRWDGANWSGASNICS
jgi:hypothetical protein